MYSVTFAVLQGVIATRLWLRERVGSERGATAVEYGLLVGLIAVVIAGVVMTLGGGIHDLFGKTSTCISSVNSNTQSSSTCP